MEAQQSQNVVAWLLDAGGAHGLLIIALGLLLSLWAIINLLFVRNRTVVVGQVFLSFLPVLVSLIGVLDATQEYMKMAASATAPKPAEFARAVSLGLACGILGPLAALVPGVLGLVKLSWLGFFREIKG